MRLLIPIRRTRPRGPSGNVLRIADGAFWLVLVFAAMLGAPYVASGFPRLVGLFLPPNALAAEASVAASGQIVDGPLPSAGNSADAGIPQLRTSDDLLEPDPPSPKAPSIAIVIDDLGADRNRTIQAIALPPEIALSFLPSPPASPKLAREAARTGHEVLVHVPMEPVGDHEVGPAVLAEGQTAEEIQRRLDWSLARIPGYVGINNHEGSLFTASRASLVPVAERLSEKHVFFFDSRTSADSQVVPVARAFGVASAARDVFLDDVLTIDGIDAQLRLLERRARERGAAIAIGHPHEITLDAVKYWAEHRDNIALVTLGTAIRLKTEREARQSLSLAGQ